MDQVRPLPTQWRYDHAFVDWSACPLRTPSGGGPCTDPGQKRVLGERTTQKGIDQSRPVTEGWASARVPLPELGHCRARAADETGWGEIASLYTLLEQEVVPRYYDRDEDGIPVAWVETMRRSMSSKAPLPWATVRVPPTM